MNAKRYSTSISQSPKRIVAGALILALALTAGTALAEQPAAGNGSVQSMQQRQSPPASQGNEGQDVSPSRINGRADWDVDYPSQLAPQAFHSTRASGTATTVAPAACANLDGCAP